MDMWLGCVTFDVDFNEREVFIALTPAVEAGSCL